MKKLLNVIAKIGVKSAVKASNTTSMIGCYQPKEPAALKNLKK
ncbi:MAG: cyclic lactone autoinducer peptide [Oscillospiraceae bacterium]|nr:cyclic lactone autoinducer peptide [Oscillospiraceae bacterium]